MSFPFRRILCPVDFDDNSLAALEVAAQIARQNDGTVLLFHVVPMMIAPTAMPVWRLPDSIRYSDTLDASPADLIEAVREQGFEGSKSLSRS
jgi:nucleotide-binding universal stress UspA family protein